MKTEITEQTENVNYISDHQCQYGSATKGQVVGPQEDSMILSKNSLPKIDELIKTFISHNCNTCGKLVGFSDAKFVRKHEKHWHENCFACSLCKVQLWPPSASSTSKKFLREDNGALLCETCGNDSISRKCDKCNKGILEGGVEYKNQPLHRGCFVCLECNRRLVDKFVSKNNGPLCLDCFQGEGGKLPQKQQSFQCRKTIGGAGILCAKGNSCGACSLTNKRTLNKDEKQYSSECLQKQPHSEVGKRCAKCDEEILANGVEYGRVKYHRKCFSCSECKQTLSGQYNVKDGMLFCQDCGKLESNHRNENIQSTKQKRFGISGFQYSEHKFADKGGTLPNPRIKEDEKGTGYYRRRKVYIQKKVRYNSLQIRREQDQRIHSSPYVQVNF